jgi:hypothetical protein
MLNMISTQVHKSLELSDPLVVPSLNEHSFFLMTMLKNEMDAYEHSSSSISISLKNETYPPLFKSSLTLDLILEPYFPPPSENVPINNQTPKRGKKKSLQRKLCLGGRSLASRHHARVKPLASIMKVGGKLPLERHVVRSDPHSKVVPIVT